MYFFKDIRQRILHKPETENSDSLSYSFEQKTGLAGSGQPGVFARVKDFD